LVGQTSPARFTVAGSPSRGARSGAGSPFARHRRLLLGGTAGPPGFGQVSWGSELIPHFVRRLIGGSNLPRPNRGGRITVAWCPQRRRLAVCTAPPVAIGRYCWLTGFWSGLLGLRIDSAFSPTIDWWVKPPPPDSRWPDHRRVVPAAAPARRLHGTAGRDWAVLLAHRVLVRSPGAQN